MSDEFRSFDEAHEHSAEEVLLALVGGIPREHEAKTWTFTPAAIARVFEVPLWLIGVGSRPLSSYRRRHSRRGHRR